MFTVIGILFTGIITGILLRKVELLKKTEKTIPVTVITMIVGWFKQVGSYQYCQLWLAGCLAWSIKSHRQRSSRLDSVHDILQEERRTGMKSNIAILASFGAGCAIGLCGEFGSGIHDLSLYILYALILQVGLNIGRNNEVKQALTHLDMHVFAIPLATIAGTLLFSAVASILLAQWSVFDCMAVGSGLSYYSLTSVLITQLKEPSVGIQLATELGTIALLANMVREMVALFGSGLISRYFGKLAPISAAGVNSMDIILPSIIRYSGKEMIPVAIIHGIITDISVPLLVSFFCNL